MVHNWNNFMSLLSLSLLVIRPYNLFLSRLIVLHQTPTLPPVLKRGIPPRTDSPDNDEIQSLSRKCDQQRFTKLWFKKGNKSVFISKIDVLFLKWTNISVPEYEPWMTSNREMMITSRLRTLWWFRQDWTLNYFRNYPSLTKTNW